MRKSLLYTICFIFLLSFTQCKSGDEEPTEQDPIIALLGINNLSGNYYEGIAEQQTCASIDLTTTALCPVIANLDQTFVNTNGNNVRLSLSLVNNQITGQLNLFIAGVNLQVSNYTIPVAGRNVPGGSVAYNLLLNSSIPATVGTGTVTLADFNAEEQPNILPGRMTLDLTQTGNPNVARIIYSISLKEVL